MIRNLALIGSMVFSGGVGLAMPPGNGCGTARLGHLEAAYLHERAWQLQGRVVAAAGQGRWRDVGEIALIDGGGGVIAPPNRFTLQGRTLRFEPEPGGYRLKVVEHGRTEPEGAAGTPLEGLGDDDHRAVALPFFFPFYGTEYYNLFVHSDGSVTFRDPDDASAARTLGRLVAGPPRIAPMFADLDPSRAPGSVRVAARPDRVVVAWVQTPDFGSVFPGARRSFEVALGRDGSVEMSFYSPAPAASVTGMGPGRLGGRTRVVNLAESGGERFDATVAEPFTSVPALDGPRLAQRFFETHDDGFDYLVVFNTAGLAAASGAVATQTTVRSFTHGIGDTLVEAGGLYGSRRRLQAFLNMGPLAQYPWDPRAPVGGRGLITGDSTLSLLAHEAGHLFLALASIRAPDNPQSRPMLGAGLAHWSFNFNSDASVLEGNRIADLGPEAATEGRFLTTATVERYSELDQYLMGLREPEEAGMSFLVWPSAINSARLPQPGVRFSGSRLDIRVEDVVAAEGPRAPGPEVAQRRFRFAFLLVSEAGRWPTEAEIAQVDEYRRAFETYFHEISSRRAWADTTLRGALGLSAWPMAGVLAGGEGEILLSRPLVEAEPLTVGLHTTHGHLAAPAEVAIPAGAAEAGFLVRGISAGVADLVAEPRSGRAAPVFARVKVAASPLDLELRLHYQEGTLAFVRVTDPGEVNYTGVPLVVTGAECVAPAGCRSGPDGLLQLQLMGAARVEISGAPGSAISIQP